MRKNFMMLALIAAALFLTTSCQNKSQEQAQDQTGQVNNF